MAKTRTCGKILGVSSSFLIGIKKMESQKIVKTFSWNRPISTHAAPKNCRWGDFLVENAPDDYMGPAKYRKRCKNLHRNFQIHVKSKFHYLQLSKHIIVGPSTEYLNFECAKNIMTFILVLHLELRLLYTLFMTLIYACYGK